MLGNPIVFITPNHEVAVMLLAKEAKSMLRRMKDTGWDGTIDCYATTFSYNGGEPQLPALIKVAGRKFLEVVRFVNGSAIRC